MLTHDLQRSDMKKRRDVAVECVEERIGVREMKWGDVTTGFTGIKTVKVWRVK